MNTFTSLMTSGARVLAAEVWEFLFRTRFARPGRLARVPGFPVDSDAPPELPLHADLRR